MEKISLLSLSLLMLSASGLYFRTTNTKEVGNKVSNTKLAYVDYQQLMALNKSILNKAIDEWQDNFSRIEEELKPVQKVVRDLNQKYVEGMKELETMHKSELTSKAAMQRKAQDLGKVEYDLRQKMQEGETLFNQKLSQASAVVKPKVDKVIDQIREEQNWDIILKVSSDAVSAKPEFNLTKQVTDRLNAQYEQELKVKAATKEENKVTSAPTKSVQQAQAN